MSSSAALPGKYDRTTASVPRAARRVLRLLERIDGGVLRMRTPHGQTIDFGSGDERAAIELRNWNVLADTMRSGDIGFAESYIRGDWDTDDLAGLLTFLVRNRKRLDTLVYGGMAGRVLHRLQHLFRRNTRAGARRNIHMHYDLGNAFYSLWLDAGMTYSSGLFDRAPGPGAALAPSERPVLLREAQNRKIERVLDQLEVQSGMRLLEIGCGWGSLAERAVHRDIAIRGLTLSEEQLTYARERLSAYPRCEFRLQDYRDERGRFDAIASVEMFEAVGQAYWPQYFQTIRRCLKPGARALVQSITIADDLFDRYRLGCDFIQQYVFPGGMLPSLPVFDEQARAAGLRVIDTFAFGQDYARTLAIWRERFIAATPQVRALGFDEAFLRTWHFYLAYCEAAFRENNTDVIQFTLTHD